MSDLITSTFQCIFNFQGLNSPVFSSTFQASTFFKSVSLQCIPNLQGPINPLLTHCQGKDVILDIKVSFHRNTIEHCTVIKMSTFNTLGSSIMQAL